MRHSIILGSVLCVLATSALLLAGCDGGSGSGSGGSGGSGGGSGGGEPGVQGACKSMAAASCDRLDACAPFFLLLAFKDKAACEQILATECVGRQDLPGVQVTPASIQACADAYKGQSCEENYQAPPTACRFSGAKADGDACNANLQCKGSICEIDTEDACGKCATALAAGAACDSEHDLCDVGLSCDTNTHVCEGYAMKDQPCGTDVFCGGGLGCVKGKCGEPLSKGADCSDGSECNFSVGLTCGVMSKTCDQIIVAKEGDKCGYDPATSAIIFCEPDTECSAASTCTARPKEGELCSVDVNTGHSDCLAGLICIEHKCSTSYPQCK